MDAKTPEEIIDIFKQKTEGSGGVGVSVTEEISNDTYLEAIRNSYNNLLSSKDWWWNRVFVDNAEFRPVVLGGGRSAYRLDLPEDFGRFISSSEYQGYAFATVNSNQPLNWISPDQKPGQAYYSYTVLLYDRTTGRAYVESTEVGGQRVEYTYLAKPQTLALETPIPHVPAEFHQYFVYSLFDDDAVSRGLSELEDLQSQRIFETKKNEIMHSMDRDNFQNISSPS